VAWSWASPLAAAAQPAPALQAPTAFPTPTPDQNGNVIYVVQEGDTAWRIAAVAGITLEQLYALNGLQSTDFLTPGMRLTLAKISPTATAAPEAGATAPVPTVTPERGSADICVMLFVDQNGNAMLDEGEVPLAGGQVSVANAVGSLVGDQSTTDDPAGYCFTNLNIGDYNVSAAVPPNYNPTTSMNTPVHLSPGDVSYVEFGAQPSAALSGGDSGGGQGSWVLGLLGVAFLLAAGVLGYIAARYNRRGPMSLR
jgi:LysM domain/SdrD B-like domain